MSEGTQAKISRNAEENQSMSPIRLWNVTSYYDFVMTVESWQVQHIATLASTQDCDDDAYMLIGAQWSQRAAIESI